VRQKATSKNEPVGIRSARIAGRYTIFGALLAVVVSAALTDAYGLFQNNSNQLHITVAASQPPVTANNSSAPYVAVRREAGFSGGCGSWIVAKPPQDVSPPPSNSGGWETWVSQNNAIDASYFGTPTQGGGATNLDVTIQGRTSTPVILTGIQFIVVHRQSGVIQGGAITNGCAGAMEARYIEVDLDSNPAKIVASLPDPFPPPSNEPWEGTPVRFPYYVTDTNGEVFKIIAYTGSDSTWYAKLFWSVDGRNGESLIEDNGKPFQTAAFNRAADIYGYNRNQWYICPKTSALRCVLND
jgi:hypothetical protein